MCNNDIAEWTYVYKARTTAATPGTLLKRTTNDYNVRLTHAFMQLGYYTDDLTNFSSNEVVRLRAVHVT